MRTHFRGLAVVGAFVALMQIAAPAQARDKLTIMMSSFGFLYLPTMVAAELGYFSEAGIDVELIRTDGGAKALAAVISGDAQINVGAPASALRARSKGGDVLVVGTQVTQYQADIVVTKEFAAKNKLTPATSYADKLKALKGMTIGVPAAAGGADQVVRLLAKEAGLNPDREMILTSTGNDEAKMAGLMAGRLDGGTFPAPASQEMRNRGGVMMFDLTHGEVPRLNGFVYIGLVVRESWAKANEALLVTFLKAEQRALDVLHDPEKNKIASAAIKAKYYPNMEKAVYDAAWSDSAAIFPKTLDLDAPTIKRIVDFVNEFDTDPLDPAGVATAWTNAYVEKANPGKK